MASEKDARDRLGRCAAAYRAQMAATKHAERRELELVDRVVELANRPWQMVDPPDTAAIIKETVTGVATILNGWRDNPVSQLPEPAVSMDGQGLTGDAGVGDTSVFVPPWEMPPRGFPEPNLAQNGGYPPYVPGEGRTTPPPGGVE